MESACNVETSYSDNPNSFIGSDFLDDPFNVLSPSLTGCDDVRAENDRPTQSTWKLERMVKGNLQTPSWRQLSLRLMASKREVCISPHSEEILIGKGRAK